MKRHLIPVLTLCAAVAVLPLFTGCGSSSDTGGNPGSSGSASSSASAEITDNGDGSYSCELYAMDTVMDLKAYGDSKAKNALRDAADKISELDDELDVTNKNSDIYKLNHRETDTVTGNVAEVLKQSLEMAEKTNGNFDPTIYPIVRAWGFTTGKYKVPSDSEISELLTHVGYDKVSLSEDSSGGTKVTFSDDQTELDTGGIGKGYTSDVLQDLLEKDGVDSAIVSLGGNVMAVGKKTDGSSWNVAIEDPFDSGQYAGTIKISDEFAITSGGYQRYFDQDGHRYIHIMDPSTGRPVENDLASVTIISDSGTQADALSTALYVMGLEKAEEFWKSSDQDFGVIFVTQDNKLYVTENIADRFSTDNGDYNVISK